MKLQKPYLPPPPPPLKNQHKSKKIGFFKKIEPISMTEPTELRKETEEKNDDDIIQEQLVKKVEPTSKLKTSNEEWQTCCSNSSRGFVLFIVQSCVLWSVLMFSFLMLADDKTIQRDLYVSLLSSIVGIYLPTPQLPTVVPPTNI